jgi:molybdopterin-containing oxidoreductase family membrane subunit
LLDGGIYTILFWAFQVILGGLLPLALLFRSPTPGGSAPDRRVALACALVIIGGFAQVYVIVIGGMAWPLNMFPGMEVSSSFYDGVIASYAPSLPEVALGLGGVALAGLVVLFGVKVLRFLPTTLANSTLES